MRIYIYIYTNIYIFIYIYIHTHIDMSTPVDDMSRQCKSKFVATLQHTQTHTQMCKHTRANTPTHTHTVAAKGHQIKRPQVVYVHAHMHTHTHTHVHTHTHLYTHTHTHTHTHTNIHTHAQAHEQARAHSVLFTRNMQDPHHIPTAGSKYVIEGGRPSSWIEGVLYDIFIV